MKLFKGEEKKVLKRLGVLSVAKIGALFGIIFGLLGGITVSLLKASGSLTADMAIFNMIGYWSIIVLPVGYGVSYFIGGAITSWLYNILAEKVGGIELTFKK
ncbi:hypothetical protein COU61_00350 [Candidatus Pacearchaeota archaeon CG10_big_fil_rev_8_21_14_0_10_35_13]|nr:MAG: hypothetical protein COU61_00350 [Candidatus Pacearchaeota archaeon CG10_big_fil_rev_8_21_14_0_10_35_13]